MTSSASADASVSFVAVINSCNRLELLQKAVASLTQSFRTAPFSAAMVVFEAGSKDGSREFLEKWQRENPDDLLTIVEPLGGSTFSDGVNQGCVAALQHYPECRWLFLYETDNWLASHTPLLQAIQLLEARPELAAAGFTVQRHSGEFCGCGMRFPSIWSLAAGQNLCLRWHLDAPNASPWQETGRIRWRTCDVVFTSPLVVRRAAWEHSGGFDPQDFPFSDSDLDWAWRCARLGWKTAVIACEGVVHDNLQQASSWSANRVVDFHRSRLRLLRRYRGFSASAIKPLLFLRHAVEYLLLARQTGTDPIVADKLAKRRQLLRTVWHDYVG